MSPRDVRHFVQVPLRLPVIRQSSIGNLETCERYFLFKDILGIVKNGYNSATHMGKVLHLCMNGYWQGLDSATIRSRVDVALRDAKDKLIEWAKKHSTFETSESKLRKMDRDTNIACNMARLMWERFPKSHFEKALGVELEVVCLEEEFSYESPYGPVGGRLDLVLRVVGTETYIILDFKTSSRPASYQLTARFAVQPKLYAALVLRKFPGSKVLGFIHAVMAKPKYDSYSDSYDRMVDWVDAKDDCIGTGEVFKSGPRKGQPKPRWEHSDDEAKRVLEPVLVGFVTRLEGDPEQQLAGRFRKHKDYATREPLLDNFDTTGNAAGHCTGLYGGDCPYLPLCGRHEYNWPKIVAEQYTLADTESTTEDITELD